MAKKPRATAKTSNGETDPGLQGRSRPETRRPETSRPGTSRPETSQHIIDTALKLAAEKGWRDLALADIAEAAGMSLAEVYGLHPSKQAILDAYRRGIDRAVLADSDVPEGSAKDRLFD